MTVNYYGELELIGQVGNGSGVTNPDTARNKKPPPTLHAAHDRRGASPARRAFAIKRVKPRRFDVCNRFARRR